MKKPVKIALGIAIGSMLVSLVYYQLGGFRPVDLALVDCTDFVLIGREFRGTPQDEELARSFLAVEDAIANTPGAILHTIYYAEPEGKRDTMHVFVGIQKNLPARPIPNMTEKWISCKRAVVAKINAHRFVMPTPLRIKEEIEEFALLKGVILADTYIDKLVDDSHVEVLAPVIER